MTEYEYILFGCSCAQDMRVVEQGFAETSYNEDAFLLS